MANNSTLNIDVLRKTINGILDFIEREQRGAKEVKLKQDHYWSITDNARYSMDEPPKELAVGSLVDDYQFVLSAYKSADQQLPIMFMHIAPLLQALWQSVPNYPTSVDGRSPKKK